MRGGLGSAMVDNTEVEQTSILNHEGRLAEMIAVSCYHQK